MERSPEADETTEKQAEEQTQAEQSAELPEDNDSALDFFRAIGKQLRFLREQAGFTQRQVADRFNYGVDQIASVERGRRVPYPDLLTKADKLYGTDGLLAVTAEDIKKARDKARQRHPAWFRIYARLEAAAVEIHEYATMVIPGLLQTEAYARALYEVRQPRLDEALIEKRVADRLSRQEILTKWPPPDTTFVVEESVLYRPIGGPEVMRGELRNLLRASELRGTEIQVMPTERADHPGLDGPFNLLTPKGKAQLGYVESHRQPRLITDAEQVRRMANQYGSIRAQALNFRESQALIEKLLGEL
jgi:transcriptional regulator with XRE-family HTH domain